MMPVMSNWVTLSLLANVVLLAWVGAGRFREIRVSHQLELLSLSALQYGACHRGFILVLPLTQDAVLILSRLLGSCWDPALLL